MTSDVMPRPRPALLALLAGALVVLSLVAVLAALAAGGDNLVLRDAGPVARIGAPVASTIAALAAALTLGGAGIAGWLPLSATDRARVLVVVAISAGVVTLGRGASLAFSYSLATGQAIGTDRFGSDLGVFLGTDLGLWLVAGLMIAAATTTVAVLGSSVGLARCVAVLAGLAAFCSAMTGHAAGNETHEVATSTMLAHWLAMGLWVGGLAALQLLRPGGRDDQRVLRGYSHLALICWIALALSGVWALAVRMNSPAEILTSAYVQLGVAKAVLLLLLGGLGALQRRQLAEGLAGEVYRRLAVLELALMGLAIALAAAMSSSPPPAETSTPPPGVAGVLTGYPLPPAPDLSTLVTAWRPDPFGMALGCVMLLIWWRPTAPPRPRGASLRLIGAVAVLVLVTSGALNVYAKVLISAHVVQHLALLLGVGALLGSAVPIPALVQRLVGEAWWRAALVALAGPALLVAAYVSPFLFTAQDSHSAHLALQMLALAAGVLAALAVRAAPSRNLLVLVLLLLAGVAAGATMLFGDALMAASWFGATGRTWWADALQDQHRAGAATLVLMALTAAITIPAVLRRR